MPHESVPDAGSLRRGRFLYFPVAPGRLEFSIELRRALLAEKPQVVAVELPASLAETYLDAVARLQPGVLGDADSPQFDSFHEALDGLLDCPHYTRPEDWEGARAPAELLSGHHVQIERWRRERRLEITARHRPDLIAAARAADRLTPADEAVLAKLR